MRGFFRNKQPIGTVSHILFAGGFIGLSIGTCSLVRHERSFQAERALKETQKKWFFKSPTQDSSAIKLENSFFGRIRFIVSKNLAHMKEEEKVVWGLISLNALVFAAWQLPLPSVQKFMSKWFLHLPIANRPITLITSVFSHQQLMHFGFNMMALYSFFPSFRKSNISSEQVVSLYCTAGAFSSLVSHLSSCFIPGRCFICGLGASGAIYSLLVGTALLNPTSKVGIFFIPGITFQFQDLLPALLLFDLAGIILRWKAFDHVAHLAGALIGYIWVNEGRELWFQAQQVLYSIRTRNPNPNID
jgi:rhomboid-like protein